MNATEVITSDIVILGGSSAGSTAAITARRHYPGKRILLVRREARIPIPCGIPYIFGTLGCPEKDLRPDAGLQQHGVELLVGEVTRIDRARRRLLLTGKTLQYERLILATGSEPILPAISGINLDGVFPVIRELDYLRNLQARLQTARNIVVIGGGFIGVELADEINKIGGKNVTILELTANCLSLSFDSEFCVEVEEVLRKRSVTVRTAAKVLRIVGAERVQAVQMADGAELPADLVILGLGTKARVDLARDAGLEIGPTGGIVVDGAMRTDDAAIFACGDCAEKISFFDGRPSPLKLASLAQFEARLAGANLFVLTRTSLGTVGVWSTVVGGLALGAAGLTETMANAHGYTVACGVFETPDHHPGAMPGATPLKVKLVFDRRSRVLLGGQVRGGPSTGEMINTIAALVQKRMTADAIAMLQVGTHPALTASPSQYPLVNAAELAIQAVSVAQPPRKMA